MTTSSRCEKDLRALNTEEVRNLAIPAAGETVAN